MKTPAGRSARGTPAIASSPYDVPRVTCLAWTWICLGSATNVQTSMLLIQASFIISSIKILFSGRGSNMRRSSGRHSRGDRLSIVGGQAASAGFLD